MLRSPSLRKYGSGWLAALLLLATAGFARELTRAERYLDDVRALAAPRMEGRGAGTKGLERAADYIGRQFHRSGLQPAGEHNYRQAFTVTTGARLRGDNRLVVRDGRNEKKLGLNEDYVPLSFSSVRTVSGPAVFAGYGISASEFGYDDYLHLDVKDKVVIVLRYEPDGFHKKDGQGPRTHHAHLITKAINARNRGAKAIVLVNGKLADKEEDELLKFGRMAGPGDAGIVMVQVKNEVADKWLQAAGKSLARVQQEIDSKLQPQSFALVDSLQLEIKVAIERTHATVHNVLAYLPGESDEYVIVGAHYDHLGRGNENSLAPSQIGTIHPGADDNASGTAALLELAREFSSRQRRARRGVLFAAFAGEEIGLLGSSYWVNHPTRPLAKAIAMVNMDMVGRIKDSKLYVGGVGTGSTFKALLESASAGRNFTIELSAGGYAASDHTSFLAKKIPVLFFFSGLHSDYHKPSDTWDKINAESAAQLLDLISEATGSLLAAEQRPEFKEVETARSSGGGGGGYGPYFGSVPDFGQAEGGVKFADVTPGSPAAKAGLKAGDVLVQFNDKPISNLYDFTDALRRSKVGDVVEVKCLRAGKTISARVTLEQRR
jgi:hypothetical protein